MEKVDFFLGDSILRRMLENVLFRKSWRTGDGSFYIDLCVGGQTILHLKRRLRFSHSTMSQWHFKSAAATVVLMIGTNDILKYTPLDTYKKMLKLIIADLRKKQVKRIFICTIPPLKRCSVAVINGVVREFAAKYDLFLIDVNGSFRNDMSLMDPDGVHPNLRGLKLIASKIAREVAKHFLNQST